MKNLISINYDKLSTIDKMKTLRKITEEIETKILVYSELGNDDIIDQYSKELKEINSLYLDLMMEETNSAV